MLAGHYSAEINQEFARSFQLVCEGQLMESVVDKKEWNQKIYFDYIHKKTVALFELCTFTVGTYFSLPKKDQDFLYKHGSILGEWFQIKNDLKTPEEKQFNFCNYFSEDERKKILTEKEIFLEKYPNLNPA